MTWPTPAGATARLRVAQRARRVPRRSSWARATSPTSGAAPLRSKWRGSPRQLLERGLRDPHEATEPDRLDRAIRDQSVRRAAPDAEVRGQLLDEEQLGQLVERRRARDRPGAVAAVPRAHHAPTDRRRCSYSSTSTIRSRSAGVSSTRSFKMRDSCVRAMGIRPASWYRCSCRRASAARTSAAVPITLGLLSPENKRAQHRSGLSRATLHNLGWRQRDRGGQTPQAINTVYIRGWLNFKTKNTGGDVTRRRESEVVGFTKA